MNRSAVGWIGMALSLSGVATQSLLPAHIGWSFVIFLGANVLWFANGALHGNRPLMALQFTTACLNVNAIRHFL